jgi:cytoskeletal protein RodZ
MYDQPETQTPLFIRVLWIALWLILIVVVAWVFIWLLFFRHQDTGKISTTKNQPTQQTTTNSGTSKKSKNTPPANTPSATNTPQTNPTAPTGAAKTAQTPDELANAGAGNIIVPFVAASVVGSAAYYVRLRRKITA